MKKRTIRVDARIEKGRRSRMPAFCVGAGRARELLMAEAQRQLARAREECGFEYIRFHGLLHDDMGVFRLDDSGAPVHDWQYLDLLFDFLLSIGMRPFVELGFMPPALASGPETIFWWKGNVTLPRSRELWTDLIRSLVRHWTERYGSQEVRRWYFEVWNEPNLRGFFAGEKEDYFSLYADTARAVKAVDPLYKVGGPATAECAWIPEFIGHCSAAGLPLDFVSTHAYGVNGVLDEWGKQMTVLDPDPGSIVGNVRAVASQVRESPMRSLEIHFTEWSASYSPRDPIHDSYLSAAWILSKLKRCEGLVDSMSYWTFTDIFEEPGPPEGPFHGGFGLMNTQGLRKPAYFAYRYLNALGAREIQCGDESAWACAEGDRAQALFWNLTRSETGECNQVFYKRDLPARPAERVLLELAGLPPGRYAAAVHRTGYRKNDVYGEFLCMEAAGSLSPAQVQRLAAASDGEPESRLAADTGPDGTLRFEVDLRENDVVFLDITRE